MSSEEFLNRRTKCPAREKCPAKEPLLAGHSEFKNVQQEPKMSGEEPQYAGHFVPRVTKRFWEASLLRVTVSQHSAVARVA